MEPMENKAPNVRVAIEELFPGTKEAIASKICPLCGGEIYTFRDAMSEREYGISGMCQSCQDDVFGE